MDDQRFVIVQGSQRLRDGMECLPIACQLADAAGNDELLRMLGNGRIDAIRQQPERSLLLPALAGKLRAARRAHRLVGTGGLSARFGHGDLALHISAGATLGLRQLFPARGPKCDRLSRPRTPYRISTTRFPARSASSSCGSTDLKAVSRAALRQLPRRTHTTLTSASGWEARREKSSSFVIRIKEFAAA